MSWLSDRLEELKAQVNPFDGGKTATTVRRARKSEPVRTQKQKDNQPGFQLDNNSLTRGVSRAFDQVNPFDRGRSWQTRDISNEQQQQVDLGKYYRDSVQQAPQQSFGNKVRDILDTNTEADIWRRQQQNFVDQKLYGGQAQQAPVVENAANLFDNTVGAVPRVLNTAGRYLGAAPIQVGLQFATNENNAARAGLEEAEASGNPEAIAQARQRLINAGDRLDDYMRQAEGVNSQMNRYQGGLFGAGTSITGDAIRQGDTGRIMQQGFGDTAQAAFDVASLGVGGVAGSQLVKGGGKQLTTNLVKQAPRLTANAGLNYGAGVSGAYSEAGYQGADLSLSDANKAGLLSAGVGTVADVVPGMLYQGGKNVTTKLANTAPAEAAMRKTNINYNELLNTRKNVQKAFDVETNPTRRRQINNYLTALDQEISKNRGVIPRAQGLVPDGSESDLQGALELGKQKTSKFSQTAQASPEVSDELKGQIKSPRYQTVTDAGRIEASEQFVKSKGVKKAVSDVKERLASKNIDDQTVSDAIATAKKLDASQSPEALLQASEIYEQLSVKLSKAGQTVQAASLLNNRTPEGLQYGAIRTLKKATGNVTDAQKKRIGELVENVRKQKPGTYEDGLARFQLQDYVSKEVPSSNTSKTVQLWKAGLLTSPRTTAGNLAANSAEAVFRKGYVDPVANAFDAVFSLFTGNRSRSMTFRGLASGTKEGVIKGVQYFKTGYDPRNPLQKFDIKNIHYSNSKAGKAAEAYTQAVFRLMGSQDQPFYYSALRNSLADQAITEAKNRGLKGSARKDFIKKFITEPDSKAMQLADVEARYAVFQDETALGKMASRLKNTDGVAGDIADFVIPFSGVPSSIATRMITRTPVGIAKEIVDQVRKGAFDQRAMTKAIAEGTAIVPFVAAGAALAKSGDMTLGYPTDSKERELWEAEGKQPYSIKFGDTWLSTNYFQPAGNLIAAGATYQDQINKGEGANKALMTALAGGANALTEQSFLQGVSGTLNAIQQPDRYAQRFAEQTAGSVVPNLIRTVARATDTQKRNTEGVVDSVKAGIPGLRQQLQGKFDMFGRPVTNNSSAPNELANPFRPSDVKNADNSVLQETRRLQDAGEGIIPTQATKKTFGEDLSEAELTEANKTIGESVQREWDRIMKDPRYAGLTDGDKKKVLDRANDTVYGFNKSLYKEDTKLNTLQRQFKDGQEIDYFAGLDVSQESANNTVKSQDVAEVFNSYGLPPVDLSPELNQEYANLSYSLDGKNDIDRRKALDSFAKKAYKSQLDDTTQSFYSLGDDDMRAELQKGTISREQMDKVIEIDNLLTQAGLQKYPQVGKTLRRELGYDYVSSSKSSGSSRSSGGRSGSKKSNYAYRLFYGGGSAPISTTKSLRSLLEEATLS